MQEQTNRYLKQASAQKHFEIYRSLKFHVHEVSKSYPFSISRLLQFFEQ